MSTTQWKSPVNVEDPYRVPTTIADPAKVARPKDILFVAEAVWAAAALLLLLVFLYLRPFFAEFEVELPVLTRWLIHPLAMAVCFVVGIAVLVFEIASRDPAKRRPAGVIALVLGLLAITAILIGAISPLISLIAALS